MQFPEGRVLEGVQEDNLIGARRYRLQIHNELQILRGCDERLGGAKQEKIAGAVADCQATAVAAAGDKSAAKKEPSVSSHSEPGRRLLKGNEFLCYLGAFMLGHRGWCIVRQQPQPAKLGQCRNDLAFRAEKVQHRVPLRFPPRKQRLFQRKRNAEPGNAQSETNHSQCVARCSVTLNYRY